jgi:hypothetical protein
MLLSLSIYSYLVFFAVRTYSNPASINLLSSLGFCVNYVLLVAFKAYQLSVQVCGFKFLVA